MDTICDKPATARFSNVVWPKALELATFYGWEPEHDEQYYLPKGKQAVSAEDANNLAAALERAVAGLSQIVSMHRSHDVLTRPRNRISKLLGILGKTGTQIDNTRISLSVNRRPRLVRGFLFHLQRTAYLQFVTKAFVNSVNVSHV